MNATSKATLTSISGPMSLLRVALGRQGEWGECIQVGPELLNMEGTGDTGDERGRPRPPLAHSFELEMISFALEMF